MQNKAIPRRDAEVKLFLDILSRQNWKMPDDFAVSIKTDDFILDDKDVATAHLRLFPNNPKFIVISAALEVLTACKALGHFASIESRHGSPCIKASIYISVKRK